MRILLVTELLPAASIGGLPRHVLSLAKALRAQGDTVGVLVRGDVQHQCPELEELQSLGVTVHRKIKLGPTGWKERSLKVFLVSKRSYISWRIASAIRRCAAEYDVIHYHGHFHTVALFLRELCDRTVITLHDYAGVCPTKMAFRDGRVCDLDASQCARCVFQVSDGFKRFMTEQNVGRWRRAVARALNQTTVLAVSSAVVDLYERALGPLSVKVVPNFIDESLLQQVNTHSTTTLHQVYDIAPEKPVAVVASTLQAEKGVRAFLEEYVKVPRRNSALVVIGTGPELAGLKQDFTDSDIYFAGWLPYAETLRHIATSDLFVVTSLWAEPSTTTIMEAHFFGVPVYALDRGGVSQVMAWSLGEGKTFPDMLTLAGHAASANKLQAMGRGVCGLSVYRVLPLLQQIYNNVLSTSEAG